MQSEAVPLLGTGFVEMSLYKRFPGQAWMQYDLFATKVRAGPSLARGFVVKCCFDSNSILVIHST